MIVDLRGKRGLVVGNPAAFRVSDTARQITGTIIPIDGGSI